MKKIFKMILMVICWIIGLILLYKTLCSFKGMDPWGLTFIFYTWPIGAVSILFLLAAISLTKGFGKKVSDKNGNKLK